ncbi:hypothetical protein BC749_10733 [Flavobacterium araucananum]|uniref:Uncharacterized protein n=1 Tax=Flavobacterium araucananum TaxID=946678 RepID=A0A227NP85_9FLAO|nr:hypothetical protein [Flavobacterium araucananum]OXE98658.1 hypothetical protein B0A64_22450 [Flavobacterium araucananum]PWJ97237.1 hypothetical protein BC749_10733 [Flavobacterium araucananum]
MKKKKKNFETKFWAGFEAENPFEASDALFDFAHLDYYKRNLTQALLYSFKEEICSNDKPSEIFIFYKAICSFLKTYYCLHKKSSKWRVKESVRTEDVFHLTSLTKQEYDNPFTVFRKAFAEKSLKEFEFFLSEIVSLSLSPYKGDGDIDLTTPYIHLIKMLDAGELMRERGLEKIKKVNESKENAEC